MTRKEKNIIKIKIDYTKDYPLVSLILFFFIFAFVGWLWEDFYCLARHGILINKGTLFGPWLPIYGLGAVLILVLLKSFREKPLLYFFMCMALSIVLEYLTAVCLETLMGMKWWDYSSYFLNFQGRVCLEGALLFGFGGLVVTYFIAPILDQWFIKIKPNIIIIICVVLSLIFSIDLIYSSQHPNSGKYITKYQNQNTLIYK